MPPGQALAPSPEVEAGRRLVAEPVMMEFEEEVKKMPYEKADSEEEK